MKIFGIVVAALLGFAILIAGQWAFRYYTAPIEGKVGAEQQLESAPSRIVNYEHYFDLCAEIQGLEAALTAQKQRTSSNKVEANIAGITAQRARLIAQYNADASKSYTRARFLGDTLPRSINPNQETTTCAR